MKNIYGIINEILYRIWKSEVMLQSRVKILIVIIIVFLLTSTCGCIHIDFGNPFRSEKPKPPEYHIIKKPGFPLAHTFDIRESLDPTYSDTQPFIIKPDTEWINVTIVVVLNSYNFINNSPIANYSILDRYVKVTIRDPKDKKQLDETYVETTDVRRQFSYPMEGDWVVLVDAVGLGYEDTFDSYHVNVFVNEPI